MNEENQDQNQNQQELPDKLMQQGAKVAEQAAKKAAKKIGKELLKLAAKLAAQLVAWIVAHIVPIIIIAAIILFISLLIPAIDNFLDEDTSENVDIIAYDTLSQYCTIDEAGIHIDKEAFLKNITVNLANGGIDLNGLGFGEDENSLSDSNTLVYENISTNSEAAQYLYKYLSASLAGEFPYIEGSDEEAKGIIKIKRKREENKEAKDLTYIGYQKFQEMLGSNDETVKEDIMNYFTLDEAWNLCIAKWYKQTVNDQLVTYTIQEVKIPYRDMVSQYTMPFIFLIDLQLITQNANYVSAVADLMKERSEIEFTIFDSVTTDTTEYNYKATRHYKQIPDGEVYYTYGTIAIDSTTKTKTEVDTIKANVTKAKTWIIEQETNYELQKNTEYPYGPGGKTEGLPDGVEPEREGTWDTDRTEYWYEEIIKEEWVKSGDTKTVITPSEFMGLWRNETGEYVPGAPYAAQGKLVAYKMLKSNLMDRPIINIITAKDELYGLLENSYKTQMHAELMKEMIKIYLSGEELTEDSFATSAFTSVYEPDEFVEGSYVGDFDVHDESLFITDLETLKKAFKGGYSKSDKLVANAQAFLDMQERYKVNAIFAASVSITETSGGRAGNAINGCHNWFNMTGKDGPYKTVVTLKGEKYNWRIYENDAKGIEAFGIFISGEGATKRYYPQGNYTVRTIGTIYCPNTAKHPTQADDWIASTLAQMSRFYEAAGINIAPIIEGGGAGGLEGADGSGYRGIHTTADGKSYVEYLQYAGPWAYNSFCGGTMKNSGCSITSVAIILSGFGIDVNPEDLRRRYPNSTNLESLIESYGLKCEVKTASTTSANEILEHLKTGNPVIINAGGYWTNSTGHYFPVIEHLSGNKVYVSNPGSSTKTGEYTIDKVFESNKKVLFISK